jgi:hypothetical protein
MLLRYDFSDLRRVSLARVTPQWAVISCGLHNRYHHPREEVLAELQATKVRTYSTDIQGAGCFHLMESRLMLFLAKRQDSAKTSFLSQTESAGVDRSRLHLH